MPSIAELNSEQIVELIATPVRIDFVKESKLSSIFGHLYTYDPNSHSAIISQFDSKDPSMVLIPGSSIQNIENMGQDEEDKDEQSNSKARTGVNKKLLELRSKFNDIFLQTTFVDKATGSEQKTAGEKMENTRKRQRTPLEKFKIIDDYVQAKRHKVIDVLNKRGIKFKEIPYLIKKKGNNTYSIPPLNGQEEVHESTMFPNTVIKIGSAVHILPPYDKKDIIGNNKYVKETTRILIEEGLFKN